MTALIDADSLVYIVGWNYREMGTEEEVKRSCDTFLTDIMTMTRADDYVGAFSDKKCFRHRLYKYNVYKGSRPPKPDWLIQWEPIIKDHYANKHGFITIPDLEADDICSALAVLAQKEGKPFIICSPDKDMKQIWGLHYDYRGKTDETGTVLSGQVLEISPEQAHKNFWMQMMIGDGTDNIAGVPGLGEVKAKKVLDEALDPFVYSSCIQSCYLKYFGPYYGPIIFSETLHTLMLLQPDHFLWNDYKEAILCATPSVLNTAIGFFDVI